MASEPVLLFVREDPAASGIPSPFEAVEASEAADLACGKVSEDTGAAPTPAEEPMDAATPDGEPLGLEDIVTTQAGTRLFIGDDAWGSGVLVLTTNRVVWVPGKGNDKPAVSLAYPRITLHAICRDTASFPHPCIYCHVVDDYEESSEVRFAPEEEGTLDPMFTAFSKCAALHPDEISDDDETTGGGWITGPSSVETDDAQKAAMMSLWDSLLAKGTPAAEAGADGGGGGGGEGGADGEAPMES